VQWTGGGHGSGKAYYKKEAANKAQCTWRGRQCPPMDTKLAYRQETKSSTQWKVFLVAGRDLRSPAESWTQYYF
jgi:hypothetical protein